MLKFNYHLRVAIEYFVFILGQRTLCRLLNSLLQFAELRETLLVEGVRTITQISEVLVLWPALALGIVQTLNTIEETCEDADYWRQELIERDRVAVHLAREIADVLANLADEHRVHCEHEVAHQSVRVHLVHVEE